MNGCISNDVVQIRSCAYQYDLKCSAPKEQLKYCYWLNHKTLTGLNIIIGDEK